MDRRTAPPMLHFLLYILFAIVVILACTPLYLRLVNGPAYRQAPSKGVTREPGERLLGPPQEIIQEGTEGLPFAFLSQAAYQRKIDADIPEGDCILDADKML